MTGAVGRGAAPVGRGAAPAGRGAAPVDPTGDGARRSRVRHDIEGLRGVAILLLLLHHVGLPPGGGYVGVDVFFVVAGFLLTLMLLRQLESTGSVNLLGYAARRAKRVLPTAALVLVSTTVSGWLLLPREQWQQLAREVLAAAGFGLNWLLTAGSAAPHPGLGGGASPVHHFWSLAVGAHFAVLWPLLVGVLLLTLRLARRPSPTGPPEPAPVPRRRQLALLLLVVLVVPSLVVSATASTAASPAAFFWTSARLWELGVGGLVALGAGVWSTWRPGLGAAVSWAGLLVVLLCAVVVDTGTAWPGLAALGPVLGAAAVLAGGFADGGRGAGVVLSLRPLVWVGSLSYGLYLWHWPLLRVLEWRVDAPGVAEAVLVGAAAFPLAWATYLLLESPFRHSRAINQNPRYALSMGLNTTLAAVLAGLVLFVAARAGTDTGPTPIPDVGSGDSHVVAAVERPPGQPTPGQPTPALSTPARGV